MFDDEGAPHVNVSGCTESDRPRIARTTSGLSGAGCWLAQHTMPSGPTGATMAFSPLPMQTGLLSAQQFTPSQQCASCGTRAMAGKRSRPASGHFPDAPPRKCAAVGWGHLRSLLASGLRRLRRMRRGRDGRIPRGRAHTHPHFCAKLERTQGDVVRVEAKQHKGTQDTAARDCKRLRYPNRTSHPRLRTRRAPKTVPNNVVMKRSLPPPVPHFAATPSRGKEHGEQREVEPDGNAHQRQRISMAKASDIPTWPDAPPPRRNCTRQPANVVGPNGNSHRRPPR